LHRSFDRSAGCHAHSISCFARAQRNRRCRIAESKESQNTLHGLVWFDADLLDQPCFMLRGQSLRSP
jgi:hypothetical protein